jgi:hypothetical protein
MGPTATIKAIETEYAGCRFRSRLEARWAVVFDHLGIPWEYEPDGLEVDGVRYLPDFRMPTRDGLYVEVKGHATARDLEKVTAVACAGRGIMVVGSIPRPDSYGPHFFMYDSRGTVLRRWAVGLYRDGAGSFTPLPFGWPLELRIERVGNKTFEKFAADTNTLDLSQEIGMVLPCESFGSGFAAGRSARFEHGECG